MKDKKILNNRSKKISLKHFLTISILMFVCVFYTLAENNTNEKFGINIAEQQQRKQITGTILDEENIPIIGANIIEAGTSNGTVTDIEGKFSLNIQENAVIHISYMGYIGQNINTVNQTNFNITLIEDTQALDEVVVVGYGTMRKSDVIGASSVIRSTEISKAPAASAAEAIIGRMAGVQVAITEGQPGAEIELKIRGGTSISQNNSPLYIIDGFASDEGMRDISPADIESIDVLKDASSTAIYGARGANGVVIITTKKGADGRGNVSYDGWVGFRKLGNELEVMDNVDFLRYQYERQGSLDGPSEGFLRRYGPWDQFSRYENIESINW